MLNNVGSAFLRMSALCSIEELRLFDKSASKELKFGKKHRFSNDFEYCRNSSNLKFVFDKIPTFHSVFLQFFQELTHERFPKIIEVPFQMGHFIDEQSLQVSPNSVEKRKFSNLFIYCTNLPEDFFALSH